MSPIQQRMPDPSGHGQVWSAPGRDIAHAFPGYVIRAMEILKTDLESKYMMGNPARTTILRTAGVYSEQLVDFMTGCIGEKTLSELMTDTGLLDNEETCGKQMLNKWLIRVILGAYFNGVRDANHPGEAPPQLDSLVTLTQKRSVLSRFVSWMKQWR